MPVTVNGHDCSFHYLKGNEIEGGPTVACTEYSEPLHSKSVPCAKPIGSHFAEAATLLTAAAGEWRLFDRATFGWPQPNSPGTHTWLDDRHTSVPGDRSEPHVWFPFESPSPRMSRTFSLPTSLHDYPTGSRNPSRSYSESLMTPITKERSDDHFRHH